MKKSTGKSRTKSTSSPQVKVAAKKSGKSAVPGKTKAKPKPKTKATPPTSSKVNVGKPVPEFALVATGGKTIRSNMLQGRPVVLYFYPKDATPGCTLEGQDFTRLHAQFKKLGAEVFGVSRDSIKSHEKFKVAQSYSIDLLSDEDESFCKMFGVIKMKNMYGKQVRGIERSTFVIDREGRLVKEWRGVKVPGHADEVLEFVKGL